MLQRAGDAPEVYTRPTHSGVKKDFFSSLIECEYVTDRNGRKEFADILVHQGNTTCVFELKYKKRDLELNFEGDIVSTQKIADGYTIKGIHIYAELLVLAAGYDGILVFNWQHGNPVFLGQIETSFANSVKIHKNSIFVATRDGIEIIQIDR